MDTQRDEKVVVIEHLSRIVLGSSEVFGANFLSGVVAVITSSQFLAF